MNNTDIAAHMRLVTEYAVAEMKVDSVKAMRLYSAVEASARKLASPTAQPSVEPVGKPQPYAYIYEWDGPFGLHQSTSSARYNGMAPKRSVPVWTTPPPAPVLSDAETLTEFFALHAAELEDNPYAYCEVAYTRATGWMAWITDKPLAYVVEAPDRKVLTSGQGDTPAEAARAAIEQAIGRASREASK